MSGISKFHLSPDVMVCYWKHRIVSENMVKKRYSKLWNPELAPGFIPIEYTGLGNEDYFHQNILHAAWRVWRELNQYKIVSLLAVSIKLSSPLAFICRKIRSMRKHH